MANLALIQGEATSVDDRVRAVVRVLLAAAGMKPVDLAERRPNCGRSWMASEAGWLLVHGLRGSGR